MSDDKKTITDAFTDDLLHGLLRGAAKGVSRVMRHAMQEVAKPLVRAAEGFEKIAACQCEPVWREVEGPDGELERVLVHGRECPAK